MEVSYHNSFDRQHSYNLNKIIFFSISISVIFQSVSLMQQINDSKCLLSVFGTEKGHPQVDLKVRRPTTTTK